MTHPYPPHWASFDYIGRHRYALTFVTDKRRLVFTEGAPVDLVLAQILRACSENTFEIIAYCTMPDHLHLVVEGTTDASDCKAFIKSAKQYSGYYYKQACGDRLRERYGHERVI
jgi:putative transposase